MDIPVDFALPRLKYSFTFMSNINHSLVAKIMSCHSGTVTARVQAMMLSART
jgi:hypothetical protein